MRLIRTFAVALTGMAIASSAHAGDKETLSDTFSQWGTTVDVQQVGGVPSYELVIDKHAIIAAFPELQNLGFLNPDLT